MLKIKTLQPQSSSLANHVSAFILGIGSLLVPLSSQADVLSLPDSEISTYTSVISEADLPRRGISKSQVEAQYGAPRLKHPAVGDPPITRWDYDGFSVFFEYQHVLHSVIPEKPKPIYNKDELSSGY